MGKSVQEDVWVCSLRGAEYMLWEPYGYSGCVTWLPALMPLFSGCYCYFRAVKVECCILLHWSTCINVMQPLAGAGSYFWQPLRKAAWTAVPAFKCCVYEKEKVYAFYGILLFPNALFLFPLRQRCQTGLCKEMEAKLSFTVRVQKTAISSTRVPPLLCVLLSLCVHLGSKLPYVVYRECKGSVSFST